MKKKNCYALFIGIDAYQHAAIPDLNACTKDAQRFLNYLTQHHNKETYSLHTRCLLTNSDALPTRANIITAIREHLGKAQEGDFILLFYAGHGSKEKAPAHFGEADGYLQTLVPCDARQADAQGQQIRNILDKEMRLLFEELWQKTAAEIIFIQDSCHSTGATRQMEQLKVVLDELKEVKQLLKKEGNQVKALLPDPVPRYIEPDAKERSAQQWQLNAKELANQYTAFAQTPELLSLLQQEEHTIGAVQDVLPLAPHIHLAACDKSEFAYEIPKKGGVFTSHLLDILEASENKISYHDLYNRARMNIAGAYQQTPDLFVHHQEFEKRHQPFLGDFLKRGALPAQRDIDIFNGFYPVVPKGRNGWQIKAGEMELLAKIDSPEEAVPIEVFLQSEQPTGKPNASITSVRPTFSKVEFRAAIFDRFKHRNKLYAMIAPHFLRRWRVSTFVETTAGSGNLLELFEEYGARKNLKNFCHDGGPAIRQATPKQSAQFIIAVEGDWLHLYDQQNKLILRSSAAQRSVGGDTKRFPVWAKADEPSIYKYIRTPNTVLEAPELWNFSPYPKNALVALFDYLAELYKKNTQQSILVELREASNAQHPFVAFLEKHAATLKYFEAFINWKEKAKEANFVVQTQTEGFSIHRLEEGKIEEVPVCRQTESLGKEQGFEIILALQHICKWQTVRNLYNNLQLALLDAHHLELEVTIYTDFETEQRGSRQAVFQSFEPSHYQQQERGLSLPLHELTKEKTPLRFVKHPKYASTIVLPMGLVLHHLQSQKDVYVSMLLLDSNFGISPLQTAMGNNVLPPKEARTDEKGSLWLPHLSIPRPEQLRLFPQALKNATFYLKILIAYERFDVSGLLQRALAPAAPAFEMHQEDSRNTRSSKVLRAPRKGELGSWLSFTIPILIEQP